jgi:hypothetical protein
MIGNSQEIVVFLMGQQDKEKQWELSDYEKKRSKNQNSYYWSLVGEIAKKTHISSNEIHNRNLRDLGLVARMDGSLVHIYLPDTDQTERDALESQTFHIKPTSQVKAGNDGRNYRRYVMLRGSSDMTVQEFSALTDLIIQEAQSLGIETLPPDKLAHMRELERQAEQRGAKK